MRQRLRLWPFFAALALAPSAVWSQGLVARDGTLGSGPLEVGPDVDPLGQPATYLITPQMGEQRGSNLFHSFTRFGIGAGETATFTGPDPIDAPQSVDNVISRVTGGDPSEIDGTLRSTIPGADVWLLNPSGVVFGDGAQLDVPGSFHASTGDYLDFGEGDLVRFYADPTRDSVLATARPGAFGFLGESAPEPISVTGATLAVPEGETLELVGGDVTLTGAELSAPAGSISIRGGQIVVQERSGVFAESAGDRAGGTIDVAASESLLVDNSLLSVSTASAGNAGSIHIEGGTTVLRNGGPGLVDLGKPPDDPANGPHRTAVGARAETSGSGNAGVIEIDARSVEVADGAGLSAQTVGADVGVAASGDGGTVRILHADSVLVRDRGFVSVESWGSSGNAGEIVIDEVGALTVDGDWLTTLTAGSLAPTSRFLNSSEQALGRPGTIGITATSVELLNGGIIQSICSDCVSRRSSPEDYASGGGQIRISAGSLLADGTGTLDPSDPRRRFGIGSMVSVTTLGDEGDAGRIVVDLTGALSLRGGALLEAASRDGGGSGGLVSVHADSVLIVPDLVSGGEGARGSGISAGSSSATGDAGRIEVAAHSLVLEGDEDTTNFIPLIIARTTGSGRGGTIEIGTEAMPVESVRIRGGTIDVNTSGGGGGGSVTVNAGSFVIEPQGFLGAIANRASGPGGTVEVVATDSILLTNQGGRRFTLSEIILGLGIPTGVYATTVLGGDAGRITLRAPEITVTDGASVATGTLGGGTGGAVLLSGDHIRVANGGSVASDSLPFPRAPFGPSRDAGSVTLEATASIEVVGDPELGVGRVSSASLGSGASGAVTLRAPTIIVDGGAVLTTAFRSGPGQEGTRGGDITIAAEELLVTNRGQLDASTFIAGPGGRIDITAGSSIRVEGAGSGIGTRTGAGGAGGEVTLRAPRIELDDGGEVSAESAPGFGDLARTLVGPIAEFLIGLPPLIATGDAGAVTLVTDKVLLGGGTIATNAEAADGGDITIEAKQLVHLDAGEITAAVNDGAGGNVTIDPEVVTLENGSRIVANAGAGSGGNIQITAENYFAFPGTVVDASSDLGIDGVVEIHTPDVDLAGKIAELPSSFLDAASLMRERCAARRSGERAGSFSVRGNGGIPAEPDGWLPASVAFEGVPPLAPTDRPAGPGSAPLLASFGTCR